MTGELRPSGIKAIGDISWGTHFCHFYKTEKNLLSILVPFFKAGLENNEYCIWITSVHTTLDSAFLSLKKAIPQLDKYLQRGSMEIITHTDWNLKNGKTDLTNVIAQVKDRLGVALQQNFDGVRINGDESWLDSKEWKDFLEYERALNSAVKNKQVIIFCAYQLAKCGAAKDLLDIALVHEKAVVKRNGKLEVLESPGIKKSKAFIVHEKKISKIKSTAELAHVSSKLDNSQSRLQAIFNTTDIAFLLLDKNFRVLIYNSIADHWSRLSSAVGLEEGANFIELLREDRKAPVSNMLKSALAGSSFNYEIRYQLKDGLDIWYRISINPVKNLGNRIIGICCSASDITADKLTELEMSRMSNDLLQRNKDLEQFAYIISHNLRAPLANIIGLSKILKHPDISSDDKNESEEFLFQSISKLDEIVTDLNQILQIRRNISEKKERVVFSELVSDVLTGFHLLIEQEHIKVITDFSRADGTLAVKSYLYSIFYNLISNSIKYRQPKIQLVIELKSWKQGNKIIITFKDNAMGIDLSTHGDEVFGLYKRFSIDTEGKGIGLYMVKNQVEAIGGNISVSSQPKVGSIFSVELPA